MTLQAIPIMLSALPVLAEMANSQNSHDTKIQEIEANERIEAMKSEIQRLDIEANTHKIQIQKEILQSLIKAATHAFDKKIDSFREAFLRSHALVEEHQRSLLEEQRELKDKMFDDLTDTQFLSLNSRLSELSGTLIDLKKVSSLMTQEFNYRISDTCLNLDSEKSVFLERK